MTISPEIENHVRHSFSLQTFMRTIQAEITRIEAGRVVIEAPVGDAFLQHQGIAHAGLVFTVADTAAGYAALTTLPLNFEIMTVEMKINLLAPASGRLKAEGQVLKSGRRLVVVGANVWAENGSGTKQVAVLQGTMIPVEHSSKQV